jgi:hypothetical protein
MNPRKIVVAAVRARSGPRHACAASAYLPSPVAAAVSHSRPGQKPPFHSGSSVACQRPEGGSA